MKSRLRPVFRAQVALAYESVEMQRLIKAVGQLPPFHLHRESGHIRVDCYSLLGGQWRCGFHFFHGDSAARAAWLLQYIEHDARMPYRQALAALAALEEVALQRVKHGRES